MISPGSMFITGAHTWLHDKAVTHAWIADTSHMTIATGVSIWTPHKGGINIVQPTGGNQPSLSNSWATQNLPCVAYDGSTSYMTADALAALISGTNVPHSWCIAVSLQSVTTVRQILDFATNSDTKSVYELLLSSGPKFGLGHLDDGSTSRFPTVTTLAFTPPVVNNVYIITFIFDGTNATIRINGQATNIAATLFTGATTTTMTKFTLGVFRGTSIVNFCAMKMRAYAFGASAWNSNTYLPIENDLILEAA